MKMITGHDPRFVAITGRAARLSCFFVRRQLAAASLLAEELLKFILASTDCPPMVDSSLTPVMRRQCSFFNGLCYMILRILSYGEYFHSAGQQLCKFHHMKTLFTRKWLMHRRICKNQLLRSDITKTRRDLNLPLKFLVQQ